MGEVSLDRQFLVWILKVAESLNYRKSFRTLGQRDGGPYSPLLAEGILW